MEKDVKEQYLEGRELLLSGISNDIAETMKREP